MLGFPIVQDALYNERDVRPRLTLSDWEDHPEVAGALDRMEEEMDRLEMYSKKVVDGAEEQLNEYRTHSTDKQVKALHSNEGRWAAQEPQIGEGAEEEFENVKFSEEGGEKVRFAGLSKFANYKYCLQCQTSHLLGIM